MRTTLTIDDDVAAILERRRHTEDKSLKELVNEALRRGLSDKLATAKQREPFLTRPVDLGRCLIGEIVSTSEALAIAEGDDHK